MKLSEQAPQAPQDATTLLTFADVTLEPYSATRGELTVDIVGHPPRCPAVIELEARTLQQGIHA